MVSQVMVSQVLKLTELNVPIIFTPEKLIELIA